MVLKPKSLLRHRPTPAQERAIADWWQTLEKADQTALRRSGRARAGVFVRYVEPGSRDESDPNIDFYEYLVNHELWLEDGRKAFICSAHPEARQMLARGHLSAAFQCPRAHAACPMRALLRLAHGRDVRLESCAIPVQEARANG